MPGLHAFTGCDFTAAFYRKDKVNALDILLKDNEETFIGFFNSLSSKDHPPNPKTA